MRQDAEDHLTHKDSQGATARDRAGHSSRLYTLLELMSSLHRTAAVTQSQSTGSGNLEPNQTCLYLREEK